MRRTKCYPSQGWEWTISRAHRREMRPHHIMAALNCHQAAFAYLAKLLAVLLAWRSASAPPRV